MSLIQHINPYRSSYTEAELQSLAAGVTGGFIYVPFQTLGKVELYTTTSEDSQKLTENAQAIENNHVAEFGSHPALENKPAPAAEQVAFATLVVKSEDQKKNSALSKILQSQFDAVAYLYDPETTKLVLFAETNDEAKQKFNAVTAYCNKTGIQFSIDKPDYPTMTIDLDPKITPAPVDASNIPVNYGGVKATLKKTDNTEDGVVPPVKYKQTRQNPGISLIFDAPYYP